MFVIGKKCSIITLIRICLSIGVHVDLLRHSLPAIKSDYEGLELYFYRNSHAEDINKASLEINSSNAYLNCPITCFGGSSDPDIDADTLLGWSDFTTGAYHLQMFENGGHFYFLDAFIKDEALQEVINICHGVGVVPPATPPTSSSSSTTSSSAAASSKMLNCNTTTQLVGNSTIQDDDDDDWY